MSGLEFLPAALAIENMMFGRSLEKSRKSTVAFPLARGRGSGGERTGKKNKK